MAVMLNQHALKLNCRKQVVLHNGSVGNCVGFINNSTRIDFDNDHIFGILSIKETNIIVVF